MRISINKTLKSLNSFLNSDIRFNDNETTRLMKSYLYFVTIHIILVTYTYILMSYYPEKYPYLLEIGIKNLIFISLLISSVAGILFFRKTKRIQVVKHKIVEDIPYYVKGVDYFHNLFPLCTIGTSLLFFSFALTNIEWVIGGFIFFILER